MTVCRQIEDRTCFSFIFHLIFELLLHKNNNNNNTIVDRHSAVASETLAEHVNHSYKQSSIEQVSF